jgi:hypothetical protein
MRYRSGAQEPAYRAMIDDRTLQQNTLEAVSTTNPQIHTSMQTITNQLRQLFFGEKGEKTREQEMKIYPLDYAFAAKSFLASVPTKGLLCKFYIRHGTNVDAEIERPEHTRRKQMAPTPEQRVITVHEWTKGKTLNIDNAFCVDMVFSALEKSRGKIKYSTPYVNFQEFVEGIKTCLNFGDTMMWNAHIGLVTENKLLKVKAYIYYDKTERPEDKLPNGSDDWAWYAWHTMYDVLWNPKP